MLGTYVNIELARMCLILQRIRFQLQVLNPCKSIQESSEEVMDFKARQLSQQLVSIEL